jgi:hypothetical protein
MKEKKSTKKCTYRQETQVAIRWQEDAEEEQEEKEKRGKENASSFFYRCSSLFDKKENDHSDAMEMNGSDVPQMEMQNDENILMNNNNENTGEEEEEEREREREREKRVATITRDN